MKRTNEATIISALASGQQTRLMNNLAQLRKDETGRAFDRDAVACLLKYAKRPELILDELKYLRNLSNDDGELFARSKGKYSDVREQVSSFEAQERKSFQWNRHYQEALHKVQKRYSNAHLRMIEYSSDADIYDAVTDWSTSAGWTGIIEEDGSKKKFYLRDIYSSLLEEEGKARNEGSFGKPIICWFRTQGSGAYDREGHRTYTWKSKKRLVFIDDLYSVASGRRFVAPLTEYMKYYPFTAVGKDDYWICRWVLTCRMKKKNYLSLDYSKYDSTIPSWLIHDAFRVVRSAFDRFDEELLAVLESDFIHKNVFTGEGLHHFDHGNVSGSAWTTVINCICNEIITETWLSWLGITSAEYNIMGDDNLIYIYDNVDEQQLSSIASYIVHNFGVKVNADKSSLGSYKQDPEYLSRFWGKSGAYRCPGEVVSLIAYPEKRREYVDGFVPALVIYSYLLSLPSTMRDMIDEHSFVLDNRLSLSSLEWTKAMREAVPYNIRVAVESGRSFVSSKRNELAGLIVAKT